MHARVTAALVLVAATVSAAAAQTSSPVAATGRTPSTCSPQPVVEGCGTFVWPDGSKYVGNFHGGYFNGKGTIAFSDGSRLKGEFRNASIVGDATYVTPTGETIAGPYVDVSRDAAHPHKPLDYPFWRALFGDSETVEVTAIVDVYGNVTNARLYRPIDSKSFAEYAIAGVTQWHYLPATVDGQPVKAPYLIQIQFATAE